MGKLKQTGKVKLSEISEYSEKEVNTILSFLANVDDFKKVLDATGKSYAEFKDNHGRDKIKGVWTNRFGNEELVTFASSFQGRQWEPDEITSLLKGDAISVNMKDADGNAQEISGYLDTYTYMGNYQVGFKVAPKEMEKQQFSKAQRERIENLKFDFIDDVSNLQADVSDEFDM